MTKNEYLIRFVQQHPTFRIAELESCALMAGDEVSSSLKVLEYDDSSPFAVVELESSAAAAALIQRSILTQYVLR